jgi:hypothetical protein
MICCVSPAGVNFYESLNALRYANRARNIQNKPVVNRDPTLVMIDDLKKLIQNLASELLEVRRRSMSASPEGSFTLTELEAMLANGTMTPKRPSIQDGESSPKRPQRRNTAFDMVSAQSVMATTRSFSLPTSNSPQNVPAGGNSPKRNLRRK